MSLNRYKPHIFILPEDDANRQIVNSFILHPNLNERVIQILPPAGGWGKVLSQFTEIHVAEMLQYPEERLILIIDFDLCKDRLNYVKQKIPDLLQERVFVVGVLSNPEKLKTNLNKSFEQIGEVLASHCSDNRSDLWDHELLKHNKIEVDRMIFCLKPFLFR